MKNLNTYLDCYSTVDRIHILEGLTNQGECLPFDLVQDLFELDLDEHEKISLLKNLNKNSLLSLEDFITRVVFNYNQNIASSALLEWAKNTDCILWHRTQLIASQPHISQRIRYTLLDVAHHFPSYDLVESLCKADSVDDYSEAYLSLLFTRAVEWNIKNTHLLKLAKDTVVKATKNNSATAKHISDLCYYILKYEDKFFDKLKNNNPFLASLTDLINEAKNSDKLKKFKDLDFKNVSEEKIINYWPNRWQRDQISISLLTNIIGSIYERDLNKISKSLSTYLSGIGSQNLYSLLTAISVPDILCQVLEHAYKYLSYKDRTKIQAHFNNIAIRNPDILNKIPKVIAIDIPSYQISNDLKKIRKERKRLKGSTGSYTVTDFEGFNETKIANETDKNRKAFFNYVYRNTDQRIDDNRGFWSLAMQNTRHPNIEDLDSLSEMSRQGSFYVQFCYLKVLSKFKQQDKAALKILDFIRSDEPPIIRGVIDALAKIDTPRSHMELIAFITRPNTTYDQKNENNFDSV